MTRRGEARGALLVQLRDLQDVEADPARWSRALHGRSLSRLESHVRTMKSASRQRHPGEKQSPSEEKADRSHAARSGGSREEKVPKAPCSANASKNCADSKDRSLFINFPLLNQLRID